MNVPSFGAFSSPRLNEPQTRSSFNHSLPEPGPTAMLRISKKADYAVFLMGSIARQGAYPGGPASHAVVSAQEISKQAGLNKSVVANLLKELAKHGLLDSTRGLHGGYRLSRSPRDISLADILVVFEGPFELVACTGHVQGTHSPLLALAKNQLAGNKPSDLHGDCSLMAVCPSKRPMRVVQDRIARLFADIRLDELCAMSPIQPPSIQPPLIPTPLIPNAGRPVPSHG